MLKSFIQGENFFFFFFFFFVYSWNFIKKKDYKDNSLTYIRWTSREKESIKTVAWNKGEQQNENKTKPKKPTFPD
jgi:hypothetical protein